MSRHYLTLALVFLATAAASTTTTTTTRKGSSLAFFAPTTSTTRVFRFTNNNNKVTTPTSSTFSTTFVPHGSRQQSSPLLLLPPAQQQQHATTYHNNRSRGSSTTTTSLSMVASSSPPSFALAAITGAISGGFFAGSLHAIAGPDHLAALLPRCCGQRWYRAGRVGALWGMGHGLSATVLGVVAFALKTTLSGRAPGGPRRLQKALAGMSHVTEIAVGLSLILIGVMGIREAREWQEEIMPGVQPQSLSAAAAPPPTTKDTQKRAVILNGLLHGFSWDGAPSLAPAVAVATWSGNLAFLSSYAAGTMAAMAITTTVIGEATRKAGQVMDRPDLPQKLSLVSSFLAIAIGVIWCGLAFI